MTPIEWLLFALFLSAKVLVVLGAALFVTRLMHRRSSAERHLVWVVASACVLALPVLSLAGPSWRVVIPSAWLSAFNEAPAPAAVEPVPLPAVEITVSREVRRERISRALGTPALAPARAPGAVVRVTPPATLEAVPAPVRAGAVPSNEATVEVAPAGAVVAPGVRARAPEGQTDPLRSMLPRLPLLFLVVWLAGTVVIGARVLVGFMRLRAVTRLARPLQDLSLRVRAHGIATDIGVRRQLRLLEGDAAAMPITFGLLRPTLLLPSSARDWTRARQNAVLRHELEHVRRYDSLTQLIAELGCALYWFNPLMWYASRRLRIEREHACDDAVLASGLRPSEYAADLLDIARALRSQRALGVAAIAMAGPSHLRARVACLLDAGRRRDRASVKLLVPAWLGAFMLVTPLSSLVPDAGGRVVSEHRASVSHAPAKVARRGPLPVAAPDVLPLKAVPARSPVVPAPMGAPASAAAAGGVTVEVDAVAMPDDLAFEIDVADREWLHSAVLYLSRRLGLMSEERASAITAAADVELARAVREGLMRVAEGRSANPGEAESLAELLSHAGLSRAEVALVLEAAAGVEVKYNRKHDRFEVRAKPRR
ncbi:MAG TPA: M56 family metallopeptidase [Longimicrobiales bacterium]|nr:M56 family metallopeptidase [Longimicrobiales bacterium]